MEDILKIHVSLMQTIALSGDIVHSQRHKDNDHPPPTPYYINVCRGVRSATMKLHVPNELCLSLCHFTYPHNQSQVIQDLHA